MHKPFILFMLAVISCFNLLAQKVDLDKFRFNCSLTRFPENYVEPSKRTYDLRIVMNPDLSGFAQAKYDNLHIDGYTFTTDNPTVIVYANINKVKMVNSTIKSRVVEDKDKDGKVKSSKTYYSVEAKFNGLGDYKISGPRNRYKSLDEMAREAKKKDKKKETNDNPFLSEQTTTTTTGNMTFDTKNYSMSKEFTYNSTSFNSYEEASRYWQNEKERQLYEHKKMYINSFFDAIRSNLSYQYGYPIIPDVYHLWILDSKSHPEYELQQKAIEAVKVLMPGLNGAADVEALRNNLKPVMDYFNQLPVKYTSGEKADKKMRYSAYYNLAKLSYLTDDYTAASDYAQKLIKNDYDTNDGENFIEQANELHNQLDFFKVKSRQVTE